MVVAGVALIGVFFFGRSLEDPSTNTQDPGGFNVPQLETGSRDTKAVEGPKDTTLKLTVPAMSRVDGVEVPRAQGDDTDALDSNAAIHLEGTGNPWEEEANVYIAGHRLGYPNTGSFLAFFDLDKLKDGDEVRLADSEGRTYTYRVYKKFIVDPSDVFVTRPVKGKDVVTLQTCTLPDYSQRLIVRAERIS